MGYLVSIQSSRTARRMLNTFRRLATQAMSSSVPSPSCMPGAVLLTRGPACSVWAASLRWPPDCGYLCVDAITFGACLVVPMAKHGRVRARCAAPSCRGMTYGLKDYLMDFHATRLLANTASQHLERCSVLRWAREVARPWLLGAGSDCVRQSANAPE